MLQLTPSGEAVHSDRWLPSPDQGTHGPKPVPYIMPITRLFQTLAPFPVTALSMTLVTLLALVDHLTGYELSFSVFYLVPITLATWRGGNLHGIVLSVFSAAAWVLVDWSAGQTYSHGLIPFWNGAVRLGFFLVTATLLARVRHQLKREKLMARTDSLTSIRNGRGFRDAATPILSLAHRYERPLALGFIDLDNFKKVNDSLGHSEGDHVLKNVAQTLESALRRSDIACRIGGDEFIILLPETATEGARKVFEALRSRLLEEAERHNWPIGFSIGVAVFDTPPESLDEMIRRADELMYRVKNTGKNQLLVETA